VNVHVKNNDGAYILVILAAFGLAGLTGKNRPQAQAAEIAPVSTNTGR
jgi:hypothetical protein